MKNSFLNLKAHLIFIICSLVFSVVAYADNLNSQDIFRGIVKQSHDNSCGSAALSNLINGMDGNVHFSELDMIQVIKQVATQDIAEAGYNLSDLQKAAEKLGYKAQWRKVSKDNLAKIKQPVILLIHLNTDFPHYAVLKGIRNNEAFLADSARGHVRIDYDDLAEESLNQQHPFWFVMAINAPKNKPKNSMLLLSNDVNERESNHLTFAQANALTLTTLSKANQLIINYSFYTSLEKNNHSSFLHNFDMRYGLTDDIQIGANFLYTDNQTNADDRKYQIYIKNRFKLDEVDQNNIILGLSSAYSETNNVFSGSFNIIAYHNTGFAQFYAGGSIAKQLSTRQLINQNLPLYSYSTYIGLNKPIGNNYLGFLTLSRSDSQTKNNIKSNYSISTGISYVLSPRFQISPSFDYSFGQSNAFSFGMNIAHVGGW